MWTGGDLAADWAKWARTKREAIVEYDGLLFDGWVNVLCG
jgi:hypothetical protein